MARFEEVFEDGQVDRGYIDRVAAWFGIGDLDFRLTRGDKRRLIFASLLPLTVVLFDAMLIFLQMFKHIPYYIPQATVLSDFGGPRYGSFWRRLYSVIETTHVSILALAAVFLVLFSIYRVTRQQASGAFALTVIFINLAVLMIVASILPIFLHDYSNGEVETEWYVIPWGDFARDAAVLAAGYGLLAMRGFSRVKLPPRGRRVRVPPSDQRAEL